MTDNFKPVEQLKREFAEAYKEFLHQRGFFSEKRLIAFNSVLNQDIFKCIIKNTDDLFLIAKLFPEHAKVFFEDILGSDEKFTNFIQNVVDVMRMAHIFPEYKKQLINMILKKDEYFKRIALPGELGLLWVVNHFSELKQELIKLFAKVLEDKEFGRIIQSPEDVKRAFDCLSIIKKSPPLSDMALNKELECVLSVLEENLTQRIFNNPKEIKRLIHNACDLAYMLRLFPEHREIVIAAVVSNDEEFKGFINCIRDFFHLKPYFPYHVKKYIANINNPQELQHWIKRYSDLRDLMWVGDGEALLYSIFAHPEEFMRIFKKESTLDEIATYCPKYQDIFNQPSVEAAAQAAFEFIKRKRIESEAEIRKNAWMLAQAHRTKTGFFSIPMELQIKISALTGNFAVHGEGEAERIACNHYGRPSP